jgi:hypothetical protein
MTAATVSGHLAWSMSDGPEGDTWRKPEPLRFRDGGEALLHPIAPAPFYRLKDGRYLVFFHGHDGHKHGGLGPRDNRGRRPTCFAVGEHRADADQPIWFGPPRQLCDTHGVGIGPESLVWLANYASLTEKDGERVFWYPDRKHFLLAKYLPDSLLDACRID